MRRLFGTDGIRGTANEHPMTVELATQLGRAIASFFRKDGRHPRVVIGKDTRLSGYMIESAMVAGICSAGADVMLAGPLPTPGIAFITASMRADAGVVISASHNRYQDNGIKCFSGKGFKLPDEVELGIEKLIYGEGGRDIFLATSEGLGKAFRIDDATGRYIVFVKNSLPKQTTLDGLKIVVDCANGAAYKVAPEVFYELGAEVIPIGVDPDGHNINMKCGSLYPHEAARAVREHGADAGISLDGDGDRCIMIDEKGNILDGDKQMAICASFMMQEKRLKDNTLVVTEMSNAGLEESVKLRGGKVLRTRVGDRYVMEEMLKGGYNLGGEQSGHLLFLDFTTTGDGIISALQLLSIMKKSGQPLSGLSEVMHTYPQLLVNVEVREKKDVYKIPHIAEMLKDARADLGDAGRVFFRYSGTEPMARITVEGLDATLVKRTANDLAQAIKEELG